MQPVASVSEKVAASVSDFSACGCAGHDGKHDPKCVCRQPAEKTSPPAMNKIPLVPPPRQKLKWRAPAFSSPAAMFRKRTVRISIRSQLGCLFMLSGIIAIVVIAVASWVTVHNFVLDLRTARYSQLAALKAARLSLSLQSMDNTVQSIASRNWLRTSLTAQANGTLTTQLLNTYQSDLQDSLPSGQQRPLPMMATVWSQIQTNNESNGFLSNATTQTGQAPHSLYPFMSANGTNPLLAQVPQNMSDVLYPNITFTESGNSGNTVSFNNRQLDASSAIFLGPLQVNSSFVLFSITRAVTDTSGMQVLGWVTLILDGRLILDIAQDPIAVSDTGLNLIIGPNTVDNRFANISDQQPYWNQASQIRNQPVHFVLPPSRGPQTVPEAQRPQGLTNVTYPWMLPEYPAADLAYTTDQNTPENSGAHLQDRNEYGKSVGVGFATPQNDLCDWIYMIEFTSKEVYAPIANLRKVILICAFSTLALLIVTVVPVTGVWAFPLRRLRNATADTIAPHSDTESLIEDNAEVEEEHLPGSILSKSTTREARSSMPNSQVSGPGLIGRRKKDMHKLTGAKTQFRIPERVKERRLCAFITDELSDLTKAFNEMADELSLQYERLEERVRERTAELEHSKKEAEAANESKSLFIANISHELKTPLNGILGMTAVCMQEEDPVRIKESLMIIYRSGDLLHHLLTDLLTFSKNQAGQALALEEKRFKPRDVAAQIRAIFSNQALTNHVNMHISYEGPLEEQQALSKGSSIEDLVLLGDQNRILQVVINLVGNALKFTPREGDVWLRIRQVKVVHERHQSFNNPWKKGRPEIGQRKSSTLAKLLKRTASEQTEIVDSSQTSPMSVETEVNPLEKTMAEETNAQHPLSQATKWLFEFEVQDTGPGIDKDLHKKIFDPFVQGDVSLARKHGGTGLGLSICQQLAKLMHGTVKLQSESGRGSTFCLRIPLNVLGQAEHLHHDLLDSVESIAGNNEDPGSATKPDFEIAVNPMEPKSRSESIASVFQKPRLLGFSQPFFSSSTPPKGSPTTEDPPTPKPKQALRVLVADDNDTNRKVVVRLLELEDVANVTVARDGEEAFEKVKESLSARNPYDLILMDVQMPRLDGRQSTRLIRQVGFTSPIVALTAFTDEMNERECFESGMNWFLGKPIKKQELKKVLRRLSCEAPSEASKPTAGNSRKQSAVSATSGRTVTAPAARVKSDDTVTPESYRKDGDAPESPRKSDVIEREFEIGKA